MKDNKIFRSKEDFIDEDQAILQKVRDSPNHPPAEIKDVIPKLKKRKLVEEKTETYFIITKGTSYREKKV